MFITGRMDFLTNAMLFCFRKSDINQGDDRTGKSGISGKSQGILWIGKNQGEVREIHKNS